jgi:hypothetical protein
LGITALHVKIRATGGECRMRHAEARVQFANGACQQETAPRPQVPVLSPLSVPSLVPA